MHHLLDQNQGQRKPTGHPSTESTPREIDCHDTDRETIDSQGTQSGNIITNHILGFICSVLDTVL